MRRRANRHNTYEDYVQELDGEAARLAHENYECKEGCQFCEAEVEETEPGKHD